MMSKESWIRKVPSALQEVRQLAYILIEKYFVGMIWDYSYVPTEPCSSVWVDTIEFGPVSPDPACVSNDRCVGHMHVALSVWHHTNVTLCLNKTEEEKQISVKGQQWEDIKLFVFFLSRQKQSLA